MNQLYSPFNRFNRMLPPKPLLVQPGNGLLGNVDEQAALGQLGQAFPQAGQDDLQSTLSAQLGQRKQRRLSELAPKPQLAAPLQKQQYSPF